MKKHFTLLVLLLSSIAATAQQKIKIDPMQLMQLQIPINANDTIWRSFKMPDSQYRGLPVFIAVDDAKFYTNKDFYLPDVTN